MTVLHYAASRNETGVAKVRGQGGPKRLCGRAGGVLGRFGFGGGDSKKLAGIKKTAAQVLLARHPDLPVNSVNAQGWAALHFAARHGSPDMLQLLLASGADLDLQESRGFLPP